MIGISIDHDQRALREYAGKNKIEWHMGFVDGGWDAPLLKECQVRGIPAIFLIDPQGRISAMRLRGQRLKDEVDQALVGA